MFWFLVPRPLQDSATDDIVIKAMGRAINKTVVIVELLKVELRNTTCQLMIPFVVLPIIDQYMLYIS